MEDKELSQWFDINDQKPWEPGVYKVPCRYGSKATYFSYWCGIGFHGGWNTIERAIQQKNNFTEPSYKKWRGLSSDPSAKPKARGNRRVTRYVVVSASVVDRWKEPLAVFSSLKNVRLYAEACDMPIRVKKIRFLTPEA